MEGVATRAQTGKAAIYRPWPSKEDLVADALRTGLPRMEAAPDLESVRDDLVTLPPGARRDLLAPRLRPRLRDSRMRQRPG